MSKTLRTVNGSTLDSDVVSRSQPMLIDVEGVTLVLPSRLFMFNEYWRILALS
jgi:hypothetical protein